MQEALAILHLTAALFLFRVAFLKRDRVPTAPPRGEKIVQVAITATYLLFGSGFLVNAVIEIAKIVKKC